eukprot:gene12202-biopygen4776
MKPHPIGVGFRGGGSGEWRGRGEGVACLCEVPKGSGIGHCADQQEGTTETGGRSESTIRAVTIICPTANNSKLGMVRILPPYAHHNHPSAHHNPVVVNSTPVVVEFNPRRG